MVTSNIIFYNPGNIKLLELSKKIGIPKQAIIQILEATGFVVPNNKMDFMLTSSQIDVIASAYINSVKRFHKKSASSFKGLSLRRVFHLKRYFSNFISSTQYLSTEEVFKTKLDDNLIRSFFMQIIYYNSNNRVVNNYIHSKLTFPVSKSQNDQRKLIFKIVISRSNHIYPEEEEEHKGLAKIDTCFSFVLNMYREAIINTIIYLKPITWININYS